MVELYDPECLFQLKLCYDSAEVNMCANDPGWTSCTEHRTLHQTPHFDFNGSSVNRKDSGNNITVFYCSSSDGIM